MNPSVNHSKNPSLNHDGDDGTKTKKSQEEKQDGRRINWGRPIKPHELQQARTIELLYRQAVGRGWVDGSAAARLRFHALARYCARLARSNAGGMFNNNFAARRWRGSAEDEAAARAGIERLDAGEPRERPGPGLPAHLFSMPRHATAGVSDENES
jgi:hypothetical protein